MSDIANQINAVINASGQAAPKITSGLANIGNGSMQDGINRIADFCTKSGVNTGTKAGFKAGTVRGVVGTTAVFAVLGGVAYLIYDGVEKNKKNKALKAEGEAILKGLEEGITEYENGVGEDSKCDD